MKNQVLEFPQNTQLLINNATVSTIAGGAPVIYNRRLFVALADIAPGKNGVVLDTGRYTLAAETGVAFGVGDELVYDEANARLTLRVGTNASVMPYAGRCAAAKASGDATCQIDINVFTPPFFVRRVVTSGEAAANSANGQVSIVCPFTFPAERCVVQVKTATTGVVKTGYVVQTDGTNANQLNILGVAASTQIDQNDVINVVGI